MVLRCCGSFTQNFMTEKNIPSDKTGSVTGGVVRPFSDRRVSPNVLYLGDCVNGAVITAFRKSPTKQWIDAECEGGIFAASYRSFTRGA